MSTLAATDPMRFHLEPPGVLATGRAMLAGMVDALPLAEPVAPTGQVGRRLWARLCDRPPTPALLAAFEAALVLLADHELAASTVAARVAASVQADPFAVVSAGLGVLPGPMHGGASRGVERLLAETVDPSQAAVAEAVLAELRARGLPEMNIDLALATLGSVAGMVSGAGEAVFAVARTAGWLAHALEEYERHKPLRPRAVYTGPPIVS